MMETPPPNSGRLAEAFHISFVDAYTRTARAKHPRLASHLPFHGQDVHVIHGGNRWWQILCVPGQHAGDIRYGPVGRFTLLTVDTTTYPDLAALPDQNGPRREEFRLAVGAGFFIYHEAFAPPGMSSEDDASAAGAALGERLEPEHAGPLIELDTFKTRLANMRNSYQLFHDLDEALDCLLAQHYRAAIATTCAAAESAVVGRVEEMGHPIRQEERGRVLGHEQHSFPSMVAEVYRAGVVTPKTRARLDMLNSLRRGIEHCRPDATIHDDAMYAWETLRLLLTELAK
jgi:hypothetical protein